jgi:hypothetical protein
MGATPPMPIGAGSAYSGAWSPNLPLGLYLETTREEIKEIIRKTKKN